MSYIYPHDKIGHFLNGLFLTAFVVFAVALLAFTVGIFAGMNVALWLPCLVIGACVVCLVAYAILTVRALNGWDRK